MNARRPWPLRPPWFVLLIFGPPLLIASIVGYFTAGGWMPILVMAGAGGISGQIMINAWHRHSARHGHRE